MPVDIQSPSLCLGIVGTGAMGRGIAQIAAQAGIRVLLFDALHGAAANACETVVGTLATLADKGKISADALAAASTRLEVVQRLDELALAQVIVEAIVEDLDVKKALFQQLEDIIAADCILATNTSSLSVTSMPNCCNSRPRNLVSASRGIFVSRNGWSVRIDAAISLMAEFLAPLIGISPCSWAPPTMAMRSMSVLRFHAAGRQASAGIASYIKGRERRRPLRPVTRSGTGPRARPRRASAQRHPQKPRDRSSKRCPDQPPYPAPASRGRAKATM